LIVLLNYLVFKDQAKQKTIPKLNKTANMKMK